MRNNCIPRNKYVPFKLDDTYKVFAKGKKKENKGRTKRRKESGSNKIDNVTKNTKKEVCYKLKLKGSIY